MAGPWEKYQTSAPEKGPWTKYESKPEKGMIRRAAEAVIGSPAFPIAGGIAGGIAGAGPGSVPLAALGGAGGEAIRQLGARALGMDAPKTSLEAAKDIGVEGATQAIGEGVGSFVLKPLAKGIGNIAKGTVGDLFQIVTKIQPKYAKTLFENPESILPSTMRKAKAAWRSAAKAAGIPLDDVSPELIETLKTDAKKTVYETFERIRGGDPVTAAEAQTAKQALKIALVPAARTEKNAPVLKIYDEMRDAFIKKIGQESPELAEANKEYAIGKAGEKFRSVFPRNLDNSPAYFRSSTLPAILAGAGFYRGDPGEGLIQAIGASAASSPLAIGSLIALAGGARGIAPYAGRTLTASLAELAKQKFNRK